MNTTNNTTRKEELSLVKYEKKPFNVLNFIMKGLMALLMILLLVAVAAHLMGMYNEKDEEAVVTAVTASPPTQLAVTTPAVVESNPVVVEEPTRVIFDTNKDAQLPVEWRKINLVSHDPRNKAVFYLAFKNGEGPASVRVLDWDRLPTSPDTTLVVKFADPQMIDDLGFNSSTLRSVGKGVPVLSTQ